MCACIHVCVCVACHIVRNVYILIMNNLPNEIVFNAIFVCRLEKPAFQTEEFLQVLRYKMGRLMVILMIF